MTGFGRHSLAVSAAAFLMTLFLIGSADSQVMGATKISHTQGGLCGSIEDHDLFGASVACLGDLDGDGNHDIAVGAHQGQAGTVGYVWILFLWADGTVKDCQRIADGEGGFPSGKLDVIDAFGRSLAALGDVDDDGVVDLAVGAHGDDDGGAGMGAVWVLFLNTDGTVKDYRKISALEGGFPAGELDIGDEFGTSVAAVGDLDGNGTPDLAVGAAHDDDGGTATPIEHSQTGAIYVLFLNASASVEAYQKISATEGLVTADIGDGDQFGYSMSSLGDVDGPGAGTSQVTLAVGAPFDDDGGSGANPNVGAVWLLFLNADGTVAFQQKINAIHGGFSSVLSHHDYFGSSVAAPGDFDGDGVLDMVVGAEGDDDGAPNAGAIWLVMLHANGSVKCEKKVSATTGGFPSGELESGDSFGSDVVALTCSDQPSSGSVSVAVGARGDDDGGQNRGAVWVASLSPGTWDDLGNDLPGSLGVAPTLTGDGALLEGCEVQLALTDVTAPAPISAFLVIGTPAVFTPLFGGVLVPSSNLILPLVFPGGTSFTLTGHWPLGVPSGTTIYFQYWIRDLGGPSGFAASNAVSATTP